MGHIRLRDLQWLYISQCLVKAARQGSGNLIIAQVDRNCGMIKRNMQTDWNGKDRFNTIFSPRLPSPPNNNGPRRPAITPGGGGCREGGVPDNNTNAYQNYILNNCEALGAATITFQFWGFKKIHLACNGDIRGTYFHSASVRVSR